MSRVALLCLDFDFGVVANVEFYSVAFAVFGDFGVFADEAFFEAFDVFYGDVFQDDAVFDVAVDDLASCRRCSCRVL